MNAGAIWWGQLGSSLRLLNTITEHLRDCRSAVLRVPPRFPWKQDFYDAVDNRRAAFSGARRLMRLRWDPAVAPGEFILRTLCTESFRALYWPGNTYAQYLSSRQDIPLNGYFVWICGVHKASEAAQWAEFVAQYEHAARQLDSHAVFIIEYDGPATGISGIDSIVYTVEHHDCRVFCLETAAELQNTDVPAYQAELALCIGRDSPELCSLLLRTGTGLLQDPVKTAMRCIIGTVSSDGLPFSAQTEKQIASAAWKAAVVLIYPILEQFRLNFVTENKKYLAGHLPITNSNGDRVTDPLDLEIGPICHIIGSVETSFPEKTVAQIRLCRQARNLLAHNKPLPYELVQKLTAL